MPSVLEQSNCGDDVLNLDQEDVFGIFFFFVFFISEEQFKIVKTTAVVFHFYSHTNLFIEVSVLWRSYHG